MTQGMDDTDALTHGRLIEAWRWTATATPLLALFVYFAPRLKAWLIRSGAAPGAAEDFAQDAMLTVWRRRICSTREKAGAATWIFTIARNRRLDLLRRDSRDLPTRRSLDWRGHPSARRYPVDGAGRPTSA
jgi:RNA polymerase sigma-70 factor (ECF subfamily)